MASICAPFSLIYTIVFSICSGKMIVLTVVQVLMFPLNLKGKNK